MSIAAVQGTGRTSGYQARRPSSARRSLERSGWRTLLTFHENHVRDGSGRLVRVEAVWMAEAEHESGPVVVVTAADPHRVWSMLARRIDAAGRRSTGVPTAEGRAVR